MAEAVIIDYGIGNIRSVQRGLEKVGASVQVTSNPETIASAERLVLPGVGAFEDGMRGLHESGMIPAISEFVETGKPLLGICLGMQMLLNQSEEHGLHAGLGFIPGEVKQIPNKINDSGIRKIPHIGWAALENKTGQSAWDSTVLKDINLGDYFYFVHSFMAVVKNDMDVLARCEYEGLKVTAAIQKENVIGLQFHPEKSGVFGLKILNAFIHDF